MKTILSALVALSVIAGVAGTASAFDTKTFYEQLDHVSMIIDVAYQGGPQSVTGLFTSSVGADRLRTASAMPSLS